MFHISASQILTARDCPAKVCFDKVDGIERKGSKAAQLGTDIHSELEQYYLHSTPVSSAWAMALLTHLPPRTDPHLYPEREFSLLWPGPDVVVNGYMDLQQLTPGSPTVHDHKSTSRFSDRLTSEALLTNPQAVFYSMETARQHLETHGSIPDFVDVQFGYVDTAPSKIPRSDPVRARMTLRIIEDGFTALEPEAMLLKRIHTERITGAQAAEQGLTNPEACFKYGPCHFRHQCSTYKAHHVKETSRMSVPNLDLLASLAALSAAPMAEPKAAETQALPPKLETFDVSAVQDVTVQIAPPDAAPNVSENDPPPPPVKAPRGRPAKVKVEPKVEAAPAACAEVGDCADSAAVALRALLNRALDAGDFPSAFDLVSAMEVVDRNRA